MRSDAQKRHEKLCELIAKDIDENPQEHEGFLWAVRSQPDWCDMLGVTDTTLRKLMKEPPIQADTVHVEGKKTVILRLGLPGPKTDRHVAAILRKVFEEKTQHKTSRQDYGMLRGLAQRWPQGAQVDIFKHVLKDWKGFKALAAIEIDDLIADGKNGFHRRHDFPSIGVILRFHGKALDLFIMHLQEHQLTPPPSIAAIDPMLWQHMKPKVKRLPTISNAKPSECPLSTTKMKV